LRRFDYCRLHFYQINYRLEFDGSHCQRYDETYHGKKQYAVTNKKIFDFIYIYVCVMQLLRFVTTEFLHFDLTSFILIDRSILNLFLFSFLSSFTLKITW